MRVYKVICEEITVDVDLEDFDLSDIIDYIIDVSKDDLSIYENREIDRLKQELSIPTDLKDRIYAMEREEFEELFEIMKNSRQAV